MGNPNEVNDPSSTNPPSSPMLDRSMTYSFNKSWIAMGLTFFLVIVLLIGRGSTNFSKDNYFMILGDFLLNFKNILGDCSETLDGTDDLNISITKREHLLLRLREGMQFFVKTLTDKTITLEASEIEMGVLLMAQISS